jgi:hypothetical protein
MYLRQGHLIPGDVLGYYTVTVLSCRYQVGSIHHCPGVTTLKIRIIPAN